MWHYGWKLAEPIDSRDFVEAGESVLRCLMLAGGLLSLPCGLSIDYLSDLLTWQLVCPRVSDGARETGWARELHIMPYDPVKHCHINHIGLYGHQALLPDESHLSRERDSKRFKDLKNV